MHSVYQTRTNDRFKFKITDKEKKSLTDIIWKALYVDKPGAGDEFVQIQKGHPCQFYGKRNCRRKSSIIQQGVSSNSNQYNEYNFVLMCNLFV